MSEAEAGTTKQPDPMEKFRELRDAYLEIWSKTLIDTVNTEGYAQASGAAVEGYLNVVAPYKEAAEQAMLKTLQQLNIPSSVDFAGLAGRFTNIEMQLDNMDAKLDRIEKLGSARPPATPAEAKKPTASAEHAAPVHQSAEMFPEAPEHAKAAADVEHTAARAQPAATPRATLKKKTAKPLPRTARKGTR